MQRYSFELRQGDKTIAYLKSIEVRSAKAVWHWIADLAAHFPAPNARIRVTDQSGEMVISVGIAAARLTAGCKQFVEAK